MQLPRSGRRHRHSIPSARPSDHPYCRVFADEIRDLCPTKWSCAARFRRDRYFERAPEVFFLFPKNPPPSPSNRVFIGRLCTVLTLLSLFPLSRYFHTGHTVCKTYEPNYVETHTVHSVKNTRLKSRIELAYCIWKEAAQHILSRKTVSDILR